MMHNELVNKLADYGCDPDNYDVWKLAEEVRAIVRQEKEEVHVVSRIWMELAKATLYSEYGEIDKEAMEVNNG